MVAAAAEHVRSSDLGEPPSTRRPHVPVVAVTGTNGKTRVADGRPDGRYAGQVVGWSYTDGMYVDGELVEAGDYSGPGGAGRVLEPAGAVAVTETARGGILLRGIGRRAQRRLGGDSVSADHLGVQGSTDPTSSPRSRPSSPG